MFAELGLAIGLLGGVIGYVVQRDRCGLDVELSNNATRVAVIL